MESPTRGPLGCDPEAPLQLSHFVAWPTATGVVRSALGGHSLTLTCSGTMTTAGTLPSRHVMLRGVRSRGRGHGLRYYDPLGLPLHRLRFRPGLIRTPLPRQRRCRRVSRVPRCSLHACCAQYPAGARRELRCSHVVCCLRRDMSGSASGLFICRGCKLHFMLRPACWLPAARLWPPDGLSTSRSGTGISPVYLGPATRRTDAYRDGTCTHWNRAASNRRRLPLRELFVCHVTTHHARDASVRARRAVGPRGRDRRTPDTFRRPG